MEQENIIKFNSVSDSDSDSNNYCVTSILITIIIGVFIGITIGYYVFKPNIYHGKDSNDVKKEIHEDSKGKFKWDTVVTICPLGTAAHK